MPEGYLLFGFGVAKFIFRLCFASIFCVVATYVMRGAIFGGFSTHGSGAVFGIWEGCNIIVCTHGSDAGNYFAG